MAEYNIGRILPLYKGAWNSTTTFNKLDIVYYGGSSYVALASSKNAPPSSSSSVWQIVASKGNTGEKGEKGEKGDTGSSATITDGSVTTAKIADGAVSEAKLSTSLQQTLDNLERNFDGAYDAIQDIEDTLNPIPSQVTQK